MVIGVIAREIGRQIGRYTVRAINLQDDALNNILRTSPTRNILGRGGIRGVRHGLAGGALASPLIEEMKIGYNGISPKPTKRPKANQQYKKYSTSGYNNRSRSYRDKYNECRRRQSRYR